jgi:NADP-dependent 3-hydroxy acid dehydrogenase YdfG
VLLVRTVVAIGGSAGTGLETARRAGAEGAKLILTGRNPERLQRAASEVHALNSSAFDATEPVLLEQFFRDLPAPNDHIMVTAGRPYYGRLIDLDFAHAGRALNERLLLFIEVARNAANKVELEGNFDFHG